MAYSGGGGSSGLLFTSTYDANIAAFDLNTLSKVRTLRGHHWEVWQLQFVDAGGGGSDGVLFSGSHDHTIKRWDIRNFTETCTLKGHKASN